MVIIYRLDNWLDGTRRKKRHKVLGVLRLSAGSITACPLHSAKATPIVLAENASDTDLDLLKGPGLHSQWL
jgi:hypothetical protein